MTVGGPFDCVPYGWYCVRTNEDPHMTTSIPSREILSMAILDYYAEDKPSLPIHDAILAALTAAGYDIVKPNLLRAQGMREALEQIEKERLVLTPYGETRAAILARAAELETKG